MAEAELVRVEIGFQSGDVLALRVSVAEADALDAALRARDDVVCELNAQDAGFLVVLERVLYVKRYSRETRVGFAG